MAGKALTLVSLGGVAAVAAGLAAWAGISFASYPATVAATPAGAGVADLTVQTVGVIGFGTHPTWVSYLVRNRAGRWVHTTLWQLPAHSTIHVTVYEYDTEGPLRNPAMGQVLGTVGRVEYLNGRPLADANSNSTTTAPAHTFTVPDLGINVPLVGVNPNASNQCSAAPCTTSFAHNTIRFSFRTGAPGSYRWQCFVPCGLGYLDGTGGPMQTLGYMAGFLDVVQT